MRFIARNIGYLYRRYTAKFYFESYLYMSIGLFAVWALDGWESFFYGMNVLVIAVFIWNSISYPFTRFLYYWWKEKLDIFNIQYNGIFTIVFAFIFQFVFKFFIFLMLWTFSFIIGSCYMVYILLNENAKEYNRKRAEKRSYDEEFFD